MYRAKEMTDCAACIYCLQASPQEARENSFSVLTRIKEFGETSNYLVYPSQEMLTLFSYIENVVVKNLSVSEALWGDIFQGFQLIRPTQ